MAVLIVWLPMFPRPAEWWMLPRMVKEFSGLEQFWDHERTVSAVVKERIVPDFSGDVPWDLFILFDAEATWGTAGEHVIASGYTVVETQKALFEELERLPRTAMGAGTRRIVANSAERRRTRILPNHEDLRPPGYRPHTTG